MNNPFIEDSSERWPREYREDLRELFSELRDDLRRAIYWLIPMAVFSAGVFLLLWSLGYITDDLIMAIEVIPWPWLSVLASLLVITKSFMLWFDRKRDNSAAHPFSSWWILSGVAAVIIATWASTSWMLSVSQPAQQLEAIKAGLTVAAGTGGAFGLLLAARRQQHQERTHLHERAVSEHSQKDADERRVNDLYIAALELLESDHSQTRQGGLADLERLGESYPQWRGAIVQLLCSFLRKPLPSGIALPEPSERESEDQSVDTGWLDSREERLMAMHILIRHLPTYYPWTLERRQHLAPQGWGRHRWNLAGAIIPGMELRGQRIDKADFRGAIFTDPVDLIDARIEGSDFRGARFIFGMSHLRTLLSNTNFSKTEINNLHITHCKMSQSSFKTSKITNEYVFTHTLLESNINFTEIDNIAKINFGNTYAGKYSYDLKIPGWEPDFDREKPYFLKKQEHHRFS